MSPQRGTRSEIPKRAARRRARGRREARALVGGLVLALLWGAASWGSGMAAEPAEPQAAGSPAAKLPTEGPTSREEEGISLNLRDVDIRDVLSTLSASRGLNFVVAPDVLGQATVNLHNVSLDEALRAVLLINGVTFVRRGGVIYVTKEGSTAVRGRAWRETASFRLAYADPELMAKAISPALTEDGVTTVYAPTRSLVVQDTPENIDRLRTLVAALDVPPRQVLIGARMLEVRLDEDHAHGIDWESVLSTSDATLDLSTGGFSQVGTPGAKGFFATLSTADVSAFLDALETEVDFEALAAPQVLALEGRQAEIIVGGKLGFYITTTTQTSTMQSVQFLNIGTLLVITPTISDDGHIVLQIHPKVSDGVVENGLPSETTTEVTTTVLVADGQTVFIGGLLRRREQRSSEGLPGLNHIPGLGSILGRRTSSVERTEIVVLITPRILRLEDPDVSRPLDLEQSGG